MNTRRALLLLTILLPFVGAPGTVHGVSLSERVGGLAAPADGAGELAYTESRTSGLLQDPVIYTGRLAFDPDNGTLTKWVDEPRQARLTLTDTQLEIQAGNGRARRLPLERQPELAVLLRGLRALLSGDAAALQAIFQADYLEGDDDTWVMQLRPLDPELAGELVLLELRGSGDELTQIDSLMGSGDRQSMTILHTPEDP
jgi:hypothetical protein